MTTTSGDDPFAGISDNKLLGYAQIAELTGLSEATLRQYKSNRYLPRPDDPHPIPDRPRWRAKTIKTWLDNRPGQGTPRAAKRRSRTKREAATP